MEEPSIFIIPHIIIGGPTREGLLKSLEVGIGSPVTFKFWQVGDIVINITMLRTWHGWGENSQWQFEGYIRQLNNHQNFVEGFYMTSDYRVRGHQGVLKDFRGYMGYTELGPRTI
jgi:hypothetical protein